jgi:hypothetical protein
MTIMPGTVNVYDAHLGSRFAWTQEISAEQRLRGAVSLDDVLEASKRTPGTSIKVFVVLTWDTLFSVVVVFPHVLETQSQEGPLPWCHFLVHPLLVPPLVAQIPPPAHRANCHS